jgi:hypothetical protein
MALSLRYLAPWVLATMTTATLLAQEGGGLGSVSACPSAPIIADAAISYALSQDAGLSASQASAVIQNIIQQSSQSAPYAAPQIVSQVLAGISQAAKDASSQGLALPNSIAPEQAASLPAALAVTTTSTYKELCATVVAAAIRGLGHNAAQSPDLFAQVLVAAATSIVRDAGVQAARTAINTLNGPHDDTQSLPMDNAEDSVAVIKAMMASILDSAFAAGVTQDTLRKALASAHAKCVTEAQNISAVLANDPVIQAASQAPAQEAASTVAGQTASQVAGQAGSQVAGQTASQVAEQVAQKIAAAVASLVVLPPDAAIPARNHSMTPYTENDSPPTLPTAPGDSEVPGVNVPPNILTPERSPTPVSTPVRTPRPTPKPVSPF